MESRGLNINLRKTKMMIIRENNRRLQKKASFRVLFAEVAQVVISSSAIFADVECIRDKVVLEGFLKLGFTPCKTEQPQ